MPSLEDRVITLERNVAMIGLLRSQDERNAEEGFPPALARTMRDINENITTLLGVLSKMGGDIKDMKECLKRLETQPDVHTSRFDHIDVILTQILTRLSEKP